MTKRPENTSPEEENKNHTYVTNRIPWFVHALWIIFWIMAITYVLSYQFPVIRTEFLNPPWK
jgi:hypothetical protein